MAAETQTTDAPETRRRGRPPKTIDLGAVADVLERLLSEGGVENVSHVRTAAELGVSRATLYRTLPTKQDLLGVLFERMTDELLSAAIVATSDPELSPGERLRSLMAVHIVSAVRMRHYLVVFFDGGWLPEDVSDNWRRWRSEYSRLWEDTVAEAAAAGAIRSSDPHTATRLILGGCIWVSRWYRPERDDATQIAQVAFELLAQQQS
jgi:AcrR family transcriptional regulator